MATPPRSARPKVQAARRERNDACESQKIGFDSSRPRSCAAPNVAPTTTKSAENTVSVTSGVRSSHTFAATATAMPQSDQKTQPASHSPKMVRPRRNAIQSFQASANAPPGTRAPRA